MPPTLGAVLRTPRLGLRLRAGGPDAESRPVRWVAISELTDPTPYLEGGELVLTTGIRWPEGGGGADALAAYTRRLADSGAAGLGFGSGVAHERVPPSLVEAAEEAGLPLIEVPRPTPFIAVGKEVSRLLAQEEYEGLTRAFAAQRRLTQAALRGDRAVVERLGAELAKGASPARAVPGRAGGGEPSRWWVLLLDRDGRARHATPEAAAARAGDLEGEVARLRAARRPSGASVSSEGESVSLQPLGVGGRVRGFLAVGASHGLGADERTLVSAAASLMSLELEHRAPEEGELAAGVLEALLDGELDLAGGRAERLRKALPEPPLEVAVAEAGASAGASAGSSGDEAGSAVPHLHTPRGCLAGRIGDRAVLVGPVSAAPGEALAEAVRGSVGVSRPTDLEGLPAARAEAERALEAAAAEGKGMVRASELPGGFLGLLGGRAGRRMAGEVLAPLLEQRSAEDLVASLRGYLAASGRWDAAAERLGIHRHTLRYRINRIRKLLPGDLSDPDYRTELWIALRLLEDE
ncbi:PucR family transcriptional regulator [Nocardiopsis sp. RSe5-2]|uniref:PucR family transcriptional regulator n=1 Tax=Nocardiopsis endophytica TaxID=3018445 RepID=A0ABT4U859_9ACTN|nr:PucR family transcriptional regulator [Nocardiopsis endophytica]MDA2812585.1 PucR family transcriptional regulator [Nocardiopsis endophytica]